MVDPSGAKRWLLRTTVRGKRSDIGLGGLSVVSLAEAREAAREMRRIARAGGDPLAERRKARAVVPTFEEAAREVYEARKGGWKNPKHRAQWITTLETYVFPTLGKRLVDRIETADVLKVLAPVWTTKAETARRLRQRETSQGSVSVGSSGTGEPGTRRRDTFNKILIGTAVIGYRYNPSARRSDKPRELSRDLASLGLEVSTETVRKYLTEAAKLLPHVALKREFPED